MTNGTIYFHYYAIAIDDIIIIIIISSLLHPMKLTLKPGT